MQNQHYSIRYEFLFPGGDKKEFELVFDESTMSLINFNRKEKPGWTRLTQEQCSCCPLSEAEYPYCPVAVNIAEMVENFKDRLSTEECTVKCITPARTCMKDTRIQQGLYSILGIVMATSDCPVMDIYKPMARFHLPFSTTKETLFRSSAVYMLQQYFEYKRGGHPDLEMKHLGGRLQMVQEVNTGIIARIRNLSIKDADANAVIILDSFSKILEMDLDDRLSSLEYLFPPKR